MRNRSYQDETLETDISSAVAAIAPDINQQHAYDNTNIQYAETGILTESAYILESDASIYDNTDALNAAAIQRILEEDRAMMNIQMRPILSSPIIPLYIAETVTDLDDNDLERKPAAKRTAQRNIYGNHCEGMHHDTFADSNYAVPAEIVDIRQEIDIHPADDSPCEEIIANADLVQETQYETQPAIVNFSQRNDDWNTFFDNGTSTLNASRNNCMAECIVESTDACYDDEGLLVQAATHTLFSRVERTNEGTAVLQSSTRPILLEVPTQTLNSIAVAEVAQTLNSIAVAEVVRVRPEEDYHPYDSSMEDHSSVYAELVESSDQSNMYPNNATPWDESNQGETVQSCALDAVCDYQYTDLTQSTTKIHNDGSCTGQPFASTLDSSAVQRENGYSKCIESISCNKTDGNPSEAVAPIKSVIVSDLANGMSQNNSSQLMDSANFDDGKNDFRQIHNANKADEDMWNDTISIDFMSNSAVSTISSLGFSSIQSKMSRNITVGTSNVMGALFGEAKTPFAKKSSASVDVVAANVLQRQLLPWNVVAGPQPGTWITTIQTTPKALEKNSSGSYELSKGVLAFRLSSNEDALRLGVSLAPPRMLPFFDFPNCHICKSKFALLKRAHHCRNCGVCVCKDCSILWPGKMIPATYNFKKELFVNICKSCDWLSHAFRLSLLQGDYDQSTALITTGNINLHSPFANIKGELLYPVHCAALGGNLSLLRFLVDELFCPITVSSGKELPTPVLTSKGRSLLRVALETHNIPIVQYLVVEKGLALNAEKELSTDLLCQTITQCLHLLPSGNSQRSII